MYLYTRLTVNREHGREVASAGTTWIGVSDTWWARRIAGALLDELQREQWDASLGAHRSTVVEVVTDTGSDDPRVIAASPYELRPPTVSRLTDMVELVWRQANARLEPAL